MRDVPEIPDRYSDCDNFPHIVLQQAGTITSLGAVSPNIEYSMSLSCRQKERTDKTDKTISHVIQDSGSDIFSIYTGDSQNRSLFFVTANTNEAWLRMIEAAAMDSGRDTAPLERLADSVAENTRIIAALLMRDDVSRSETMLCQRIAETGKFRLFRRLYYPTQISGRFETFFVETPCGKLRFSLSHDGWYDDNRVGKPERIPFQAFVAAILSRDGNFSGHDRLDLTELLIPAFSDIENVSDCERVFQCPRFKSPLLSARI